MTRAQPPRPSTTRAILSATSWALLVVAGALLAVAGLAAWRCPDPTTVLVGVTDGLGWVAIAIGVPVTGGAVARKLADLRGALRTEAPSIPPGEQPTAGAGGAP